MTDITAIVNFVEHINEIYGGATVDLKLSNIGTVYKADLCVETSQGFYKTSTEGPTTRKAIIDLNKEVHHNYLYPRYYLVACDTSDYESFRFKSNIVPLPVEEISALETYISRASSKARCLEIVSLPKASYYTTHIAALSAMMSLHSMNIITDIIKLERYLTDQPILTYLFDNQKP